MTDVELPCKNNVNRYLFLLSLLLLLLLLLLSSLLILILLKQYQIPRIMLIQ